MTSSWRPKGAADRVRRSHVQTRTTLRLALVFIVAAALAATAMLAGPWSVGRWLPLHLFLAGAVVLAISGVTLMLTVTWSAAPAPPDRWVAGQRVAVAVGAAGIALARTAELPDAVVALAGALYLAGLVALAALLVVTIRLGVERRFDVAVAAYLVAVGAGVVGVGLGVAMAVSSSSGWLRAAHATTNLLGLVGLVVGGTIPFFAATVGRSRLSRRATPPRLAVTLGWQVAMLLIGVSGLLVEEANIAAAGLGGYAVGIVVIVGWLPRPTTRQLRWAGPRLVALWAGCTWWAIAVAATAIDVADHRVALAERWLFVLVVAGYAQILWGSLAYLLPMLRGGGHEILGEGFATTRSWVGLAAANAAGVALVGSWEPVAAAAVAVWLLDSAWRAARIGTAPAARPSDP